MFYIFYGEDSFSLREALEALAASLGLEGLRDTNVAFLEGNKLSLGELLAPCNTPPFLAPARLVVVQGLLSRFEARRETPLEERRPSPEKEWGGLKGRLKEMPPSTCLVLVDGEARKENWLLRLLSPLGEVRHFPPLRPEALRKWIQERGSRVGASLSPQAIRKLAEEVGPNLWALASEIEKLALYARGRVIEEEDVVLLVSHIREGNIFALADAIIQGRGSEALKGLRRLLAEGERASHIVPIITRQLRLIVQTQELLAEKAGPQEFQQRLGVASPFLLSKLQQQARECPPQRLKGLYRLLLKADLAIKSGQREEVALEMLVADTAFKG